MIRLREMWILMLADRKKAGALAALGAVLLFMLGRQILEVGPASASGSTPASENEILEGGRRAITLDELRVEGPMIDVATPAPAGRNVFGFNERAFPDPAQSPPSSEVGEKSDTEGAESPAVAERARAEQIARLVREEAGGLRLKSTLMGPNPMAVIEAGTRGRGSPRTLRIGDQVEGFTLVHVEVSRVVLEKHGVEVELER